MEKLNLSTILVEGIWYRILNIGETISIEESPVKECKDRDWWSPVMVSNFSVEEFLNLKNTKKPSSIFDDTDFLLIVISDYQMEKIGVSTFTKIIKNKYDGQFLPIIVDSQEYFEYSDKYRGINHYCIAKDEESVKNIILGLIYPFLEGQIIGFDFADLLDFLKNAGRITTSSYEGARKDLSFHKFTESLNKSESKGVFISMKSGVDFSLSDVARNIEKFEGCLSLGSYETLFIFLCDEKYPSEDIWMTIYGRENEMNEISSN